MFFILSKTLFYLVMPLTWILAALLLALFTKKEKRRKRALIAATVLLVLFTNPFLSNEAWLLWEHPPTPLSKVKKYDAAIILTGGVIVHDKSPRYRIYSGHSADRMMQPLQLYKQGYVKKIIISGGSGSLTKKHSPEATEIKKLMIFAGVPPQDILVEDKSRNTHENATYTKSVLQQHPEFRQLLLVTSAFHLRRAYGCFKKEGIVTDVFSTNFYTTDRSFTLDNLIPQEIYLYRWQKLFHEILGYVVYDITGYC